MELYLSKQGFIFQLFKLIRFSLTFSHPKENSYFNIISFGIWKFDVSLAIEMDKNAHNIKAKWNL
tara:strand:- start:702 stop:896 length:195 start_codon:yes stop_codon:yes gene_type:complete